MAGCLKTYTSFKLYCMCLHINACMFVNMCHSNKEYYYYYYHHSYIHSTTHPCCLDPALTLKGQGQMIFFFFFNNVYHDSYIHSTTHPCCLDPQRSRSNDLDFFFFFFFNNVYHHSYIHCTTHHVALTLKVKWLRHFCNFSSNCFSIVFGPISCSEYNSNTV